MEENLPEGWVKTTLGDICTIIMGQSPPSSEYNDKGEGHPFFQGKAEFTDLYPQVKKWCTSPMKIAEADDILLSVRAPVGPTNIAPSQCCIGRGLAAIRPEDSISLRYILYAIRNFNASLIEVATGSTFEAISGDDIRAFKLPLAPLPEQHRIVSAIEQQFTRLDSAIASLKSAQAKTKQYRASLLKAAVEGELTKEWRVEHPTSEKGVQLLARILAERRLRWEEEQLAKMREKGITPKDDKWKQRYEEPREPDVENLPMLPEGWCWATVEQIIAYLRNGLPQKPEISPTGYRILRINAVRPMKVDLDEVRYLSLPESEAQDYIINNGDILFTRYNGSLDLLGVAGVVKGCSEPTLHPDKLIRVKTVLKGKFSLYIEIACNVGISRAFIESRARTTAGQKGISGSDIKQVPIPLPPLAEQEQIISEVEARLSDMVKLEEAIENSLKRAENERQSILREAFAGRLVPQDPEDEPASVLLERIREERKKREEAEKVLRVDRKSAKMDVVKRRRSRKAGAGQQTDGLYEKLVEAGQPLPPEELFKRVGLKTDEQPESVDVFCEELDADVEDELIAEIRPDFEHVLLEALEPSAEVLARMEEEERAAQAQKVELKKQTVVSQQTLWNA